MKNIIKKHKIIMIILLINIILLSIPMFINLFYNGDDFNFHISRIEFVTENIKTGNIFSGMYYIKNWGYGEGFFYPDFFLIIPSIINIITKNTILSYNFSIMLIQTLSILTMYYSIYKITKNKKSALIASIIYGCSPYRLTTLYLRSALGESIAFIFLPLIFYGLNEILNEKYKNITPFIIGLSGIILSHVLTFLILIPIIIIILLINIKKLLKEKERIKSLLISFSLIFLISALFTLPMLEQMHNTYYKVITLKQRRLMPDYYALKIQQIFTEFNFLNNKGTITGIGSVLTLSIIFILIHYKNNNKYSKQLFILGIISLLATTNLFPWKLLKNYVYMIQFPFRLISISTVLITIVLGMCLPTIKKNKKSKVMIITILLLCIIPLIIIPLQMKKEKINAKYETSIAWGEYLPLNFDSNKIIDNYLILENTYPVKTNLPLKIEYYFKNNNLYINYKNNSKKNNFQLPIIYYKGYKITTEKNKIIPYRNKDGLVEIEITDKKGKVTVKYKRTLIQYLSLILSFIGTVILIIYNRKRKKCS